MYPEEYTYFYFIGIGGIGMSALARYFKALGKEVAGYDRTCSTLTKKLASEGIPVTYKENIQEIPPAFLSNPQKTLIVFTPAVPESNEALKWFREQGFHVIKRSDLLGAVFNQSSGVAVAGTHGKTTVSTLTAWLLYNAGKQISAFLGGISKNFRSNLVLTPGSEFAVAEADEFDRSFLKLFPSVAVITSMDPDHLDIYKTWEAVRSAFFEFTENIKPGGVLILREGLPLKDNVAGERKVYRYGFDPGSDFAVHTYRKTNTGHIFNLKTPDGIVEDFEIKLPGKANLENAVAALAACFACGAGVEKLQRALAEFEGVQRRFDIHIDSPVLAYVDDYGHHPEEIKAFIAAMRDRFPGRHLTGIFQPHLYTRTRDFADGFAESLSMLDRLVLLDIYPARELPIPGVDSGMIFKKVTLKDKYLIVKEELPALLNQLHLDVVATMGAGDIDTLVEPITAMLTKRITP